MEPSIRYLKLIENMESDDNLISNDISEDKDTREKRKEERREKRQEKKFGDSNTGSTYDDVSSDSGTFKLPAFIKAIEGLKNQIIAQLVDTDIALKSEELGGKRSAEKYKSKFLDLLDRVAKILSEANYRREKEGKRLEDNDPNDRILIKGYRENYNSVKSNFKETLNSYIKDINTEKTEYLANLKHKDIVNHIEESRDIFANALKDFASIIKDIKTKSPIASGSDSKKSTLAEDVFKIESPVKKGIGSKSKPDDTVKKVQELILKKFKNKEVVTKTEQWKKFAKYGADGSFGNATGNLISLLKAGFGMTEKTSDINQIFVDELNSLKESKLILNYDLFLKLNEEWSDKAFTEEVQKKAAEKPANTSKKEEVKADKKEETGESIDSKEVESLLIKASDAIVNLFGDASFWEEFKGTINDDEEGAGKAFSDWFGTTFSTKYFNPAESKSNKVQNSDDKQILDKNLKTLKDAGPKIVTKISGGTTDDNFYWKIYLLDGGVKSYKINTDF